MNAVLGFSDLLSTLIRDERQKSYIKAIQTGGKNLLMLINDILDIATIESGKLKLRPGALSIRAVLEEIQQIFSLTVKEKNLRFTVQTADNIPDALLLDETRLKQILFNLVGNATKFTEHGHIEIRVKRQQINTPGRMNLILTVEDTGPGISPEFQNKIFGAFEQERVLAKKHGGTGLGLNISKNLANLMDGELAFLNTSAEGSIFVVTFYDVKVLPSTLKAEEKIQVDQGSFPELPQRLPVLLDKLNKECMPLWKKSCDSRLFDQIEYLAEKINLIGKQHSSTMVCRYGEALLSSSRHYDVEQTESLLRT